ncbi:MAG TPA: FecR domain-containing protein [Syntrophales bacterium]|nr:FecR domain-containing protein [Syntrophales bacterium]
MKRKIWFAITIVLALMLAIPPLAMTAPVGKVTHVEGNVDITRAGSPGAREVILGESVEVGDVLRTKSKSKAAVTFSDDNILRIAASSRVTIQEYMVKGDDTVARMKLHRGMVQAISSLGFIKRLAASPEQNRYEVNTKTATCGIRGSNMIVSYHGGVSSVLFITGHGYIYNSAKPDLIVPITAGNISFIDRKEATPTSPRPFSDAELDTKVKAVTPSGKSKSEQEPKQEMKGEAKDVKDRMKKGDIPGLGEAPTDAADLPAVLAVIPPGKVKRVLDLKTADRTLRTTLERKGSAQGKTGASQGAGGGASVKKGASSSSSSGDKVSQYLKEKKEQKEKKK